MSIQFKDKVSNFIKYVDEPEYDYAKEDCSDER